MKRFTDAEEQQYAAAKEMAEREVRATYESDLLRIREDITHAEKKSEIRALDRELNAIEAKIVDEAKPLTKEYFDYEIPIAVIEDAGITSTGAVSAGNQLPQLLKEYEDYRSACPLWDVSDNTTSYLVDNSGRILRKRGEKEEELTW